MKLKNIIGILTILLIFVSVTSSYSPPPYDSVNFTMNDSSSYSPPPLDSINLTFGATSSTTTSTTTTSTTSAPTTTIIVFASDLTLEGYNRSITAELNSLINVTSNLTRGVKVCLDIDHPLYGINFSCKESNITAVFNTSWFRKSVMNDNTFRKNLSFRGKENKSFFIPSHQYDEIENVSINFTGIILNQTYPTNVKIYINRTLSNTMVEELISTYTLTTFNDSSTFKEVTFGENGQIQIRYLAIPKIANVTKARFNFTGIHYRPCYQNDATADNANCGAYINTTGNYGSNNNFNDNNWATQINSPSEFGIAYYYFNFSKSTIASSVNTEMKYRKSSDNSIVHTNKSVGSGCLTYLLDRIVLRERMRKYPAAPGQPNDKSSAWRECYDGSLWVQIPGGVDSILSASATSGSFDNAMTWTFSKINDPWFEAGSINGTRQWNWTGDFNTTNGTADFSDRINTYLSTCIPNNDGICMVPMSFNSDAKGILNVTNVSITYKYDWNPIRLNVDLIRGFLQNSSGAVDVEIVIENEKNGTIEISDIRYDYAGGNRTYEVVSHVHDYSTTRRLNITYYYSDWEYAFPNVIKYIEFIPFSSKAKNVSPYGQTPRRGILNITSLGYSDRRQDIIIYANETSSCVDTYSSSYRTKPNKLLWDELLAYYRFDVDARDSQGLDNNGTFRNVTLTQGKLGYAGVFNGVDSLVNVTYSDNLEIYRNITIAGWVYPISRGAATVILSKGADYVAMFAGSKYPTFQYYNGASVGWNTYISEFVIPLNRWSHYVFTYNWTDPASAKLYINGTDLSTLNLTIWELGDGFDPAVVTDNKVYIGNYALFNQFNGTIDEVRLYNRTLTPNEVYDLYNRSQNDFFDVKLVKNWELLEYNATYLDVDDFYFWADYDCSYSGWRWWQPEWYFRSCCQNCDVCGLELV